MTHSPTINLWQLPGGTKSRGEDFPSTAVREIAEEVGLHYKENCIPKTFVIPEEKCSIMYVNLRRKGAISYPYVVLYEECDFYYTKNIDMICTREFTIAEAIKIFKYQIKQMTSNLFNHTIMLEHM